MTEQGDPRNLIRRKGWIQVDFNKAIWVPCPPFFAPGVDREKWAAGYARACWAASRLKYGKRQITALAQSFSHIHQISKERKRHGVSRAPAITACYI